MSIQVSFTYVSTHPHPQFLQATQVYMCTFKGITSTYFTFEQRLSTLACVASDGKQCAKSTSHYYMFILIQHSCSPGRCKHPNIH